jgi:transcriptional regulator with XRE-family HTH domain
MRRSITASEVAARAGVSRPTLQRLERGSLQVSLAVLARVLEVLGLDDGLDVLATSDELGERLSDARLTRPRRSTKPSLADEL